MAGQIDPQCDKDGFIDHTLIITDFDKDKVHASSRIDRIQGTILPLDDFIMIRPVRLLVSVADASVL